MCRSIFVYILFAPTFFDVYENKQNSNNTNDIFKYLQQINTLHVYRNSIRSIASELLKYLESENSALHFVKQNALFNNLLTNNVLLKKK